MGKGVYRSDYAGVGRSINVEGLLVDDEGYDAHVREAEKAGDEPVPRTEYDQDAYDGHNEFLVETVAELGRELGMEGTGCTFGEGKTAFGSELTRVASGDVFEFGWLNWEHDYVISVGPSSSFTPVADNDAKWSVEEKGRSPDALRADYDALLPDAERLLRLSLLKKGFATSRPTSSYTSRADEVPDDVDAQIVDLTAKVKAGIERLARGFDEAVGTVPAEERVAIADAIYADMADSVVSTLVLAWDGDTRTAGLWDPTHPSNGLRSSVVVPPELAGFLAGLPKSDEGPVAVPFADETASWYRKLQGGTGMRIVLSPEQYVQATGEECAVAYEVGERKEVFVLHEAPAPAASP